MGLEFKYVEANGCTFNAEEKIRIGMAIEELKINLSLTKPVYLSGKITGKFYFFYQLHLGVVGDYYTCIIDDGTGKEANYWCSSSNWVFSKLPDAPTDEAVCKELMSINCFFTGEYDLVLMEGSGPTKVIDASKGIKVEPKPVTELDRLSFVVS